ncbi:DMT family transporter [Limibaculum sp. M0105]|uniref:DMT family transporter n=1 Tax=Thermohalobaculum xanthum TaxID=2753746 RepID=A0A8J7SJN7_9RHOB|nr:DMT family transporter [Thermohalobaculum xanthum]MBK0401090.1 DMT family transporter [Thermohalobaculum xanthum]
MSAGLIAAPATGARPALLWVAMLGIGAAWGSTQLLAKIGMAAGHHPVGVTFWQALIGLVILTIAMRLTGRRLPLGRRHLAFYAVCGLLGTALPSTLSYEGIRHLPVGVQSIVLSTVPMMTLVLALPLRIERAEPLRVLGLGLGLAAMLLLVGPEASLPDPSQAAWVVLPVLVALSYSAENVVIARWMPPGTDPVQAMCGLLLAATLMVAPTMLALGATPDLSDFGWREGALLASAVLNVGCYLGFVWLIANGGAVFAAQTAYVVTGSGVALGMMVLGERHSPWVWAALGLLFAGLALVRPRRA